MVGALRRFKVPETEIDQMSFSEASKKLDELIKGARAKQQESQQQPPQTEQQALEQQEQSKLAIISELMEITDDIWSHIQGGEEYQKLNEITRCEIFKVVLSNYSKLRMTSIISSQRKSGGYRRG